MDLSELTANMSLQNSSQTKREDYIDWREYFMATAFLAAKRSKDPSYQVGACIVNSENKIVGVGYNGMPIGCSDDEFPWGKNTVSPLDSKFLYVRNYKVHKSAGNYMQGATHSQLSSKNIGYDTHIYPYLVCHAEMNAILNKNSADVKGCTIYVGLFPCNECAKMIIQSGIKEVIYLSDKNAHKPMYIASKKMFDAAGVKYWQYVPKHNKIEINFAVDWDAMSPSK